MLRSLVLGAIQGLTEFVPISSSAHLVLVPYLLNWPVPDLAFDVAVHLGTALAVVVYFWRDLWAIAGGAARTVAGRGREGDREHARLALLLVVASVPAAIAGILLEGPFEELFTTSEDVDRIGAPVVAGFLVVTAALLVAADAVHRRRPERRGMSSVGLLDAVVVGLFQALAIAPGISRSGATIGAGMFRGLSRDAAARFSFLLGLPAIAGAALVALPDLRGADELGAIAAATAVSAATGFAAIAFLLRWLRTRTLSPFAAYCVLAAAVVLAYWSQTR
ncbi:MAG TPA: undecaprenyl-diphosphate phosphatase [Actinomycetota bacterium]|nr:undecaprenyl-diphosphate phosphatase [Actinomycetota bacterium]